MFSKCDFAVVGAMLRATAVSAKVHPPRRLASTSVSVGVSLNASAAASAAHADQHGSYRCRLQSRPQIATRQVEHVGKDRRFGEFGQADGKAGLADAGFVVRRQLTRATLSR